MTTNEKPTTAHDQHELGQNIAVGERCSRMAQDEACNILDDVSRPFVITSEEEGRLLRKIDLWIMPVRVAYSPLLMTVTYTQLRSYS